MGERRILKNAFIIPQRHVLAIMLFFAILNCYQMRQSLNVAINVMVKEYPEGSDDYEDECPTEEPDDPNATDAPPQDGFDWSDERQGLILSSFYWGYVLTHIPGGLLADKYGGKYPTAGGIFITAIGTLLIPAVAKHGSGWMLVCRIMTGLGEGIVFPAVSALLARWMPLAERSLTGSLVYAGAQIGTITGNLITGSLLDAFPGRWSIVFYFFGGIGVLWTILFLLLCYSEPDAHPFIKNKEKVFLENNLTHLDELKLIPTPPWRYILLSAPLWGLVAAQLGHDWCFFTVNTDLPKYMKDILRYNIKDNAFLSSVPYIAMWIMSAVSGRIADYIITKKWLSITRVRKSFTTVAQMGPTIFLIAAVYSGCHKATAIAMFTLGMACMGFFYPGMKVNVFDLSPNYAGTLMAIVNGFGAISGIITPIIIGAITKKHSLGQWKTVFWITAGVSIVTNTLFVIFGSGKVQPWNDMKTFKHVEDGIVEETEDKKNEIDIKNE